MTIDLTPLDTQVRLMIGEFVITICALEAQKAQLMQENAALVEQLSQQVARSLAPTEPV